MKRPKPFSTPISKLAVTELNDRAATEPPDELAKEYITVNNLATNQPPLYTQATPAELAEMSIEQRVENYMANLGEPLTMEEHRAMEAGIKELEKLPYEELLRRHNQRFSITE